MSGQIHLNNGDDLSETELAKHSYRTFDADTVDVGLSFNYDNQANTVDVTSGFAIVADDSGEHMAFPTSVDATSGVDLPVTSGVNRVWLVVDVGNDSVSITATDDTSSPTSPAFGGTLELGTVDTSADTTSLSNRGRTYQLDEINGGVTAGQLLTSLLGSNLSVVGNELTANIDGGNAAQLGGNSASYYAPLNAPQFTGIPAVNGVASALQIGLAGQGGPHRLLFGNQTGEDQGFVGFRTSPNTITIENDDTGTKIAEFPIDGSTPPRILGNDVRTVQDGNSQPNITSGPNPPDNPDQYDIWFDTSGL